MIEHSCSIVPLKRPWCAFHIVQRYTHAHFFISLISAAAHSGSVNSNRKVVGHSLSTVPLKTLSALFAVCNGTLTPSSRSSEIRTQSSDYVDKVKRCSTMSSNNLRIMLNIMMDLRMCFIMSGNWLARLGITTVILGHGTLRGDLVAIGSRSPLLCFFSHPPLRADTYHDLRPACAVGVMRAVSTPRQHCRVVVMMRLLDEFDMMVQSPEFD